jgi:negative regulator of flagellin synthesis FlgM
MAIERIDGSGPLGRPDPAKGGSEQGRKPAGAEQTASDRLDLSPDARSVGSLAAEAAALPDVRWERVSDVRDALARGTYSVDARQLARSIVDFEDALRG